VTDIATAYLGVASIGLPSVEEIDSVTDAR
jgi:hypothetical protein